MELRHTPSPCLLAGSLGIPGLRPTETCTPPPQVRGPTEWTSGVGRLGEGGVVIWGCITLVRWDFVGWSEFRGFWEGWGRGGVGGWRGGVGEDQGLWKCGCCAAVRAKKAEKATKRFSNVESRDHDAQMMSDLDRVPHSNIVDSPRFE